MDLKTTGIVISKVDFKENDRILTLFSPEKGKMTVTAKGVKKQNSKLRAGSEVFAFGSYVLNETRGRYTVTGYDSIDSFHELREDFDRLSAGALLLNICNRAILPDEEQVELFTLLIRCLDKLRNKNIPIGLTVSTFLIRFCTVFGYAINTGNCTKCGGKDDIIAISPRAGGVVCKNCAGDFEHFTVSGACIYYLKSILNKDFEDIFLLKPTEKQQKELYRCACNYTAYFFDERIKIMEYIAKYDLV